MRRSVVRFLLTFLALGASGILAADSLVWDFSPASPGWSEDWRVQSSITSIGGILWATGVTVSTNRATIFEVDPVTGAAAAFPLGSEFGANPAALAISAGPNGDAWFIGAQLGSGPFPVPADGAFLGEITPVGTITMTALPTGVFNNNSQPALAYDPVSGILVWAQDAENAATFGIGVRTAQGQITTVGLSAPGAPASIAIGNDGAFYFTDVYLTGIRIGRLAIANGAVTFPGQVTFPEGNGGPYPGGYPPGIAIDGDGVIYFADPSENALVRLTPSGQITKFAVPTATSGVAEPAVGLDGDIYFTEAIAEKVGRLDPSTGRFAEFSPPSFFTSTLNLLSPISTPAPGWGGVFATAFRGPGLLRMRDSTAPCPTVRNRSFAPIVVENGKGLGVGAAGLTVGFSPDHGASPKGFPPNAGFVHATQSFGIAGTPQGSGEYVGSVTVVDSAQCPVDDVQVAITALPAAGAACDPTRSPGALCVLDANRFWLGLTAEDPRTGSSGLGTPIPQLSSFGYFSLPSFTNDATFPEVMVKMIDARSISCCFWLFHTGLTDLQYTLTAFDTVTGNFKQYRNDRSDPTKLCGAADTSYFDGVSPAPSSAELPVPAAVRSSASEEFPDARREAAFTASGPCVENDSTVCLLGNRFSATLSAVDPRTNDTGVGHAIPQKDNFGYFSLPSFTGDATFPEVFVKMVDGTSFTCCFWVFHSGLTDLEYTLTITDTTNGASKTYHNDRSDPSELCGGADTSAFR